MANLLFFGVASLAALTADPGLKRYTFSENHMGTRFKILLYAADEAAANAAARAAFARVAALDGIMSDYRPASELMLLGKKSGGDPVPVSDELFLVLARSQKVAERSGGAFDVTVGPAVRLWRMARKTGRMPEPQELAAARAVVGYDKVRLDPQKKTVQLLKPGMQLDLGGIAKGYAADEALRVLKQHGVTRALVAAGGDIAVSGPPPGTDGWSVGIQPLEDPDANPKQPLRLQHAAVSTSGDAEQFVAIDGKRYSHIVDPRTGVGLTTRMAVTVVAPDGITADSLTKVVAVLGPEKGLPIIEETAGVAGRMIRKTATGEEVIESKRFRALPRQP